MIKKILSLFLAAALAASALILPASAAENGRFSDLTDRSAIQAAEALRLMGVMDGYGDGTFRPGAQLTRAQFCKMAVCAMDAEDELDLYTTITIYPDVKPSHWAAGYINLAAKGKNIIAGFADGKFYPDRPITVGQAATILLRVLGYQDKDMSGVWPRSYVALAAREGLLDGVDQRDGSAPLTRAAASRLFLNLLRADCAGDDGSFLAKTGLEAKEDAVLISSSAMGSDGKRTALQLASGEVYQLAGGKESNGALNGSRGTLVLKNGRALTFLPDSGSGGKTVSLAGASALQLTDSAGVKYVVENGTGVLYNGKQQSWSEVYAWLNPGASLTLYLNDAGNPAYIVVGGGTAAEEAVVVYQKGSVAGFDALTGGAGNYTIYKNGSPAASRDLLPYDVAVYSAASNSVRVTDTRITGYYEDCRPSPAEAAYVTVMGCEFPVLITAQASLSAFKPGDRITLLLTEDNRVAGAAKPESVSGNALGVVKSNSGGSAEVELLCGVTVKGRADSIMASPGDLVRAVSEEKGTLRLYRQGGDAGGELNLTKRTLGGTALAENVTILEYGPEGLVAADISALPALTPSSQVRYGRKNWAGKVDLILLGGDIRSATLYGRASVTSKADEESGTRIYYLEVDSGRSKAGPFVLGDSKIVTGDFVAATSNRAGSAFTSAHVLTKLPAVPNTAWTGRTAVNVDGRSREVPADVVCWNRDAQSWITLDAARAYADKANLYADSNGVIRVVEVGR